MAWGMPQAMLPGDLGGSSAAEFGMRPDRIVVEPPGAEDHPCVAQGGEQRFVEAFVVQPVVEAFAECILLRFAGSDVAPGDAALLRPAQDGHRGQLGAIVTDNTMWPAAGRDHGVQLARHPRARQ